MKIEMKKKPLSIRLLGLMGRLLPGNYLKTLFYHYLIAAPRRFLHQCLNGFYRIDHIYEVLRQAKKSYKGHFSILEFGTADGYSFTKMLYATKFVGMADRVIVHTFDTFEGMPPPKDWRDEELITGDSWAEGQFPGRYAELEEYCRRRYKNYEIHKGLFEDSITQEFCQSLKRNLPILIWIDCDFYSSTRVVFEKLIPYIPNGCVIYFDDIEVLNYGSRFTGEARLVAELNRGDLGEGIELVLDRKLSMDLNRCYRFIGCDSSVQYEPLAGGHSTDPLRLRTNDSAMP